MRKQRTKLAHAAAYLPAVVVQLLEYAYDAFSESDGWLSLCESPADPAVSLPFTWVIFLMIYLT
jgi:hypothetical protein